MFQLKLVTSLCILYNIKIGFIINLEFAYLLGLHLVNEL